MKVVLFCGGLGTRLREYSETIPKPLVPIGYRPIIWYIMKYYAHYGHKDFILCLGYKGDMIKRYFVEYQEYISNDFVMHGKGNDLELLNEDISDWKITFVDTGLNANIGERLLAVRPHLEGEPVFLANYADGLSDAPLDVMLENFYQKGKIASLLAFKPNTSFHVTRLESDGSVRDIVPIGQCGLYINSGFFIFKQELFDYMRAGEELVEEPFQRLAQEKNLISYRHESFFRAMDTFKDKKILDDLYNTGNAPWEVWNHPPRTVTV